MGTRGWWCIVLYMRAPQSGSPHPPEIRSTFVSLFFPIFSSQCFLSPLRSPLPSFSNLFSLYPGFSRPMGSRIAVCHHPNQSSLSLLIPTHFLSSHCALAPSSLAHSTPTLPPVCFSPSLLPLTIFSACRLIRLPAGLARVLHILVQCVHLARRSDLWKILRCWPGPLMGAGTQSTALCTVVQYWRECMYSAAFPDEISAN